MFKMKIDSKKLAQQLVSFFIGSLEIKFWVIRILIEYETSTYNEF